MSANIYWTPIIVGERHDLDTWRPNSFMENLYEYFGREVAFQLNSLHIEWLKEIAEKMGVDGGGHSEARQLIEAIEKHGQVMVEVES